MVGSSLSAGASEASCEGVRATPSAQVGGCATAPSCSGPAGLRPQSGDRPWSVPVSKEIAARS
eukprot:8589653-Heterocapsa_arctica.AAC.1